MPARIEIVVFFGLIATGKSTLASAWAREQAMAYYNSDRVRKELAGLTAGTSGRADLDAGIYTPEFTRRTYAALLERARADIHASRGAVLDASYQLRADRDRVRDLAQELGVAARFVLCTCPEAEMRRRMEERAKDPLAVSDGRWEIYLGQKARFQFPAADERDVVTVATIGNLPELLAKINELVARNAR